MLRRALAVILPLAACLIPPASSQELGGCHVGEECFLTTWEECYELCGCYCGEGTSCEDICFCDVVPDPDVSYAQPWDDYGRVLVTPGSQSSVGEVNVAVLYQSGVCVEPIAGSAVEIDLSDCSTLCIDSAHDGLFGVTDEDGMAILDPRVGGCEECVVLVKASGVTIAVYDRVVSPDWDGAQADGHVGGADFAFFATAFKQSQDTCADYNGDGLVSATDFSLFSQSFQAGDANEGACQ